MSATPRFDLWMDLARTVRDLDKAIARLDTTGFIEDWHNNGFPSKVSESNERVTDFRDIEKELGDVLKYAVMAQSWINLINVQEEYDGGEHEVTEL